MATLSASSVSLAARTHVLAQTSTPIPWYIWCAALAGTSLMIGGHWDISWHESIGRDTFWTPAHMAIYLCGVLSGLAFGYLILHTTFSRTSPLSEGSVHIWGFRAPLGAFIASWGGIAMLTSAPFDNWWHSAYGLDVKIVSPPHILLFTGGYAVLLGTMVLIAGHMNRLPEARRGAYRWVFLYMCGMMLTMTMVILLEYTQRVLMHDALPYILVGAITPIVLAVGSRTTGIPFAATFIAGFYVLFNAALIWILPLFPAEPKLGPVYQHVTHFIPQEFPMLLVIPAFLLDLFWRKTKDWNVWSAAAASAVIYIGSLLLVQWPFADFLMSPASRNAFFGTTYFFYGIPPTAYVVRNEFYPSSGALQFALGILIALVAATITIRWGIFRGAWFKQVQR